MFSITYQIYNFSLSKISGTDVQFYGCSFDIIIIRAYLFYNMLKIFGDNYFKDFIFYIFRQHLQQKTKLNIM